MHISLMLQSSFNYTPSTWSKRNETFDSFGLREPSNCIVSREAKFWGGKDFFFLGLFAVREKVEWIFYNFVQLAGVIPAGMGALSMASTIYVNRSEHNDTL